MTNITNFANSAIDRAIEKLLVDPGSIFATHIIDMLRDLRNVDFAEFIRKRERIKDTKKVKMSLFDSLINQETNNDNDDEPARNKWLFHETVPSDEPVNPALLLDDMVTLLRRFVIADEHTICAAALWCAFTWFHDVFKTSPLAIITAPEMRAGKTILLLAMAELVRRPLVTSNISAGAMVRTIDKFGPTLLVDEVDSFLRYNDELRGIINGGLYKKNAYIVRCSGEQFNPQVFSTWAPKALAGIGKMAPTIEDRAIRMVLRRKMVDEHVDPLSRTPDAIWHEMRSRLARFCADSADAVGAVDADPIRGLDNRANDCWAPLLAVATLAGDEWLSRAVRAARALSMDPDAKLSIGVQLLASIRVLMRERPAWIQCNTLGDFVTCGDLLAALLVIEDEPWQQMQLSPYRLGCILMTYGIRSVVLRTDDARARGYYLGSFADVFERYLPKPATEPQDT